MFISWKLSGHLLASLFIHVKKVIIHLYCGFLVTDNEYLS